MRKILEIGGIVAGVILIAFGVAAIVLGMNGKGTVGTELKQQMIVGTPDMTPTEIAGEVKGQAWAKGFALPTCTVANLSIDNGDRARCFAQYMRVHTLEATQGLTYSQMSRYKADPSAPQSALGKDGGTSDPQYALVDATTGQPVENGARNIWVTETALTTALNASYMAEQMANFGIVVGIALLLSGIGFAILAIGGALRNPQYGLRLWSRPAEAKTPAVPVA